MRKQLIASLVGALILFFWQFLSWNLLNVHGSELSYTPKQQEILGFLSQNLEEGSYFLPTAPPGTPASEHQEIMNEAIGKPWAQISYHSKMEMSMGMNLVRGFLIDLLSVWILIWLLSQFAELDFKTTLFASLAVGAIGYFTFPYLESIWFEGSTLGYIIDTIVQWGGVGVWLGWFLNRK